MRVKVTFKKTYNGSAVKYTKEVSEAIAEKQLSLPEKDRNPAWKGAVFADEEQVSTPAQPTEVSTPAQPVRRRQRTETPIVNESTEEKEVENESK